MTNFTEKKDVTEKMWQAFGLDCKVIFVRQSHRCGYVAVPYSHPAYGLGYDDIPVQIHGGLTFSETGKDGRYWLGFDCAHTGDMCLETRIRAGDHFWTLEEVVKETEKLAEQLSKFSWEKIIKAKLASMPEWFRNRVQVLESSQGID